MLNIWLIKFELFNFRFIFTFEKRTLSTLSTQPQDMYTVAQMRQRETHVLEYEVRVGNDGV